MEARYTAVFERRGNWWIGSTVELPGANVQERTLDEARSSLREAILLLLEVQREIAAEQRSTDEVIPEEIVIATRPPRS